MKIIRKPILTTTGEWNYIFAMSDIHFGNIACDETKLKEDLEEARKLNARIFIVGDIFDAIFSGDPRFKQGVPAEWTFGHDDSCNVAITRLTEILLPYADLIDMISPGNHENSYIRFSSFDPISALIYNLNSKAKSDHKIEQGSYLGFFQYVSSATEKATKCTVDILYWHGKGGATEVTKGAMDFQRTPAKFLYDIFLCGHNHFRNADTGSSRIGITGKGGVKKYPMKNVRCGTYQNAYVDNDNSSNISFAQRKQFSEVDTGCAIVKWRWIRRKFTRMLEIKVEV